MKMPKPQRIIKRECLKPKELQDFMNFHGISRRELSEIFGVTTPAVSLWLTGQREFSVTNSRLVRLFDKYPKLLKEF